MSLKSENIPTIRKAKIVENVLQEANTQTEDESRYLMSFLFLQNGAVQIY